MVFQQTKTAAGTPSRGTAAAGAQLPGALPNFLLIGAMKAGTTSLYHYLNAHPQISMPLYKAPEFFIEESNWHRGINWYRRQFPTPSPGVLAIGEASNAYTKYPRLKGIPQRIATYIPDVKLIYIIRDPIARIRSHYQTKHAVGTEKAPFEQAVFSRPIYVDYSRYALQIEQYLRYFHRDQLLIITAEDLRQVRPDGKRPGRHATMRKVYQFLEVDADYVPADLDREFYQTKDRAVRSPIPAWLRKRLKKYFPASKRFKEMENNVFRKLKQLRAPQKLGPKLGGATLGLLVPQQAKSFTIGDDVREELARRLKDDIERLRKLMGPDFDGWGIG